MHAVAARSTFRSQNVQSTPFSEHFWKLRCSKSARSCGAKHISKSKCGKHTVLGAILEVEMLKKCTQLRREAHFEVKMCKAHRSRSTFWTLKRRFVWQAHRTFEEDLQRWISRGRRNTRDMFIRDIRRSARRFPETGCILEYQIFTFAN